MSSTNSIIFGIHHNTQTHAPHPMTRTHSSHVMYQCVSCLTSLSPSDASVISRLRFNRARLNQSLHKRRISPTDKCPTCVDAVETVEHVVMHCPRYDAFRFACFCSLAAITKQPPLSSSFPFPFLLCSFPNSVIKAHANQFTHIISVFLSSVRRLRDM